MVKKTYSMSLADQERLISLALRHRRVSIEIDETNDLMNVDTTILDNNEPTSSAACFKLTVVSNEHPHMTKREYNSRSLGLPE